MPPAFFFITTDTAITNSWTIANQNSPQELLSNEKNRQINSHSHKNLASEATQLCSHIWPLHITEKKMRI
jgi:hypothetical protein